MNEPKSGGIAVINAAPMPPLIDEVTTKRGRWKEEDEVDEEGWWRSVVVRREKESGQGKRNDELK